VLEIEQKLVAQGFSVAVCDTGFGLHRKYDDRGRAVREAHVRTE